MWTRLLAPIVERLDLPGVVYNMVYTEDETYDDHMKERSSPLPFVRIPIGTAQFGTSTRPAIALLSDTRRRMVK